MIPYLLAAVGGYLIGQSQKKDVPQMADGGMYAEGGVLAHGLREDDKIYVERGNLAGIKNHKTDEKFIVDISTGSREKLKD